MGNAVDQIEHEHRNIARVLKTLEAIVDRLEQGRRAADVDRLFDICLYLRVFPDAVHHPKEDQYLFRPLRAAAPEQRTMLDAIQSQHERCSALTEELYQAVKGYDAGEASAAELKARARAYLEFQFEHMRLEERDVLPLAAKVLDASTLAEADRAFSAHGDPLFGENLETGFEALYRRIDQGG